MPCAYTQSLCLTSWNCLQLFCLNTPSSAQALRTLMTKPRKFSAADLKTGYLVVQKCLTLSDSAYPFKSIMLHAEQKALSLTMSKAVAKRNPIPILQMPDEDNIIMFSLDPTEHKTGSCTFSIIQWQRRSCLLHV